MMNIALFISGSGSLLQSFKDFELTHADFVVAAVVADRECGGLDKAVLLGYETAIFPHMDDDLLNFLENREVGLICLAGFLQIVPSDFISKFKGKILNTHPSLIPKYCGKNYYGDKVHRAVLDAKESESGFTIIEVTPEVDLGPIIHQEKCEVRPGDTIETLKERIQALEKEWYPKVAYEQQKNS